MLVRPIGVLYLLLLSLFLFIIIILKETRSKRCEFYILYLIWFSKRIEANMKIDTF